MWLNISAKAKTIVLLHKNQGRNISQIKYNTYSQQNCRKHRNSPNSSSFTIDVDTQLLRKSHLLLCKIGIFSSATAIVLQTKINCSYARASKQQLTAHTSIVKGDMAKCYKHASFSSNALLYSLVLKI